MNKSYISGLSPQEETAVDLHKSFLVANAQAYAMHNARAFEDAAKFARQAIRGLFLLHGACATAVIATGMVEKMKYILLLLGAGALFAVATAWCAFFLHRKIAIQEKKRNDTLLRNHFSILHKVILPDSKIKDSDKIKNVSYCRNLWYCSMLSFGIMSIASFIYALYCFYNS